MARSRVGGRSSLHQQRQTFAEPSLRSSGLAAVVRTFLARRGLELIRVRTLDGYLQQYADLCAETEALYRHTVFPDLPPRDGRVGLLQQLEGTNVSEAMFLLHCLHGSLAVEGDICEFGVAQGATSALVANEILNGSKALWLFDSFQGLPRPTEKDALADDIDGLGSIESYQGRMHFGAEMVLRRLRALRFPAERTRVVAGFVEQTLQRPPAQLPDRVCFAYVDMDFYEPICTALSFLDDHLSPGGFVLVDDYGHFSTGAQAAVDEFVTERASDYALTLPPAFAGQFAILQRRPRAPDPAPPREPLSVGADRLPRRPVLAR